MFAKLKALRARQAQKAVNLDTAYLALTTVGRVPMREAAEVVRLAGIDGRMTEGEAVVAAFRMMRIPPSLRHRVVRRP